MHLLGKPAAGLGVLAVSLAALGVGMLIADLDVRKLQVAWASPVAGNESASLPQQTKPKPKPEDYGPTLSRLGF